MQKDEDIILNQKRREQIAIFQKNYMSLIKKASELENTSITKILLKVTMRSSVINKYDRITGDSITVIADKLMKAKPKLKSTEIFHILISFIAYQDLNPDKPKSEKDLSQKEEKLLLALLTIVQDYREGI